MIDLINKIHSCDNIDLLSKLQDNSIDLIYSDILYGTGRNFGDYQDLKPIKPEIDNHYIPRIKEMKRVLKDSGTIYLQMDFRINHWIRLIFDDIFGYDNFRNEIIWHYNSAPRKKLDFGNRHDTIFRYSKTDNYIFNPIREPYSLSAPRGYEKEKYYNPEGKVVGDVWNINMLGQNDKTERVGYATQKPLALIERIITASSNENDLVGDFYCGSGTTLVAAKKLKRNFIGCDLNPKAVEISEKRLLNM
jgi:site-specific DNA-methyltransferase (adenine-specific)